MSLKAESLSGESVRVMLEAASLVSFSCLWPSADPPLSVKLNLSLSLHTIH